VCFWNKEDADKAVKQCELVKKEMGVEVILFLSSHIVYKTLMLEFCLGLGAEEKSVYIANAPYSRSFLLAGTTACTAWTYVGCRCCSDKG
jgi:hypothetical protein